MEDNLETLLIQPYSWCTTPRIAIDNVMVWTMLFAKWPQETDTQ